MLRLGISVSMLLLVLVGLVHPESSEAQADRSVFSALDTGGRALALGQEQSGSLTASDVLSAGGHRVQVWTLGTSLGEELQVE